MATQSHAQIHVFATLVALAATLKAPDHKPAWPRAAWLTAEVAQNFSGRPNSDLWEKRLLLGIEAARADPCNAAVLITSGPWDNGFGAHMQNVVNDVWLAAYDANNSIAICAETPFMGEVWMRMFDNSRKFPICRAGCRDRYPGFVGSCQHASDASRSFFSTDQEYMSDLKRFALSSVFQIKGAVLRHINQSFGNMNLQEGKYVGVHIRHGDKGTEAKLLPASAYVPEIKRALRDHGLNTVFLASDDLKVAEDLKGDLGETVKIVHQQPRDGNSYLWRVGGNLRNSEAKASQITLLTDIMALRRAKVFVGTGSSTFGRLVYFLRRASESAVSLDIPWTTLGA